MTPGAEKAIGWGLLIAFIVLAVFAVMLSPSGPSVSGSGAPATQEAKASCLLVLDSRMTPAKDAIVGEASNECGRVISKAFVEFNIFDGRGAQIESSIDVTSNLGAGVKWVFRASVINHQADSYKLSKVTAYVSR